MSANDLFEDASSNNLGFEGENQNIEEKQKDEQVDKQIQNDQEKKQEIEDKSLDNKDDHKENPDTSDSHETVQDHPVLPSRKPIHDSLKLNQQQLASPSSTLNQISYKPSANYLLQSKYQQINKKYEEKDPKSKRLISSGTENAKKTFNDIKNTVGGFNDIFEYKIDWEFWTQIVNDYDAVIANDAEKLHQVIKLGIPKEFRGIVWQVISRSKNFDLEELYMQLKNEKSIHEKSIKRDLTRTSFFTSIEKDNKSEELFNVIKAYSLFDPDVGYTQGMIFIIIPLIMNMTDSECFCLLVTLMKDYKLRDLFCPEMKGLHLFLYEFDKLLESYSPILYNHLVRQGIKSSMYASQWFLTFFAYKFPLNMVLRIYDIVITQGIESVLKFAINLMIKNETNLLALKFDGLLQFLKDNLFNIYINDDFVKEEGKKRFSILGGLRKKPTRSVTELKDDSLDTTTPTTGNSPSSSSVTVESSPASGVAASGLENLSKDPNAPSYLSSPQSYYNLNRFVNDSMEINLNPVDLAKYELEFENICTSEKDKISDIEDLKITNGKLRSEIKHAELLYNELNFNHTNIVQKMIDIKIKLPEILNENDDLENDIKGLRFDLKKFEEGDDESTNNELVERTTPTHDSSSMSSVSISNLKSPALPTFIENDIQQLLIENAKETEKFANLQEELDNLILEDERLNEELKNHKNGKWFSRWG